MQHRLDAGKSHRPVRYLVHRTDERHDTTKQIIETVDGDVARLVAINGKPLTAEATAPSWTAWTRWLCTPKYRSIATRASRRTQSAFDRLLALLPDAFHYRFEGMTPCAAGQCTRLSFTPNPHFTPPNMEADLLRGVAGEVWIDSMQERADPAGGSLHCGR